MRLKRLSVYPLPKLVLGPGHQRHMGARLGKGHGGSQSNPSAGPRDQGVSPGEAATVHLRQGRPIDLQTGHCFFHRAHEGPIPSPQRCHWFHEAPMPAQPVASRRVDALKAGSSLFLEEPWLPAGTVPAGISVSRQRLRKAHPRAHSGARGCWSFRRGRSSRSPPNSAGNFPSNFSE